MNAGEPSFDPPSSRDPDCSEREPGPEGDEITPADGPAAARWVAQEVRKGRCPPDGAFDRYLPAELRRASDQYWTPLEVALRVAGWFEGAGVRTVVDIGSGAGKFCIAAALASRCHFTGLEQRPRLVSAARILARAFDVAGRVTFVEGTFGEIDVPPADAYYLYNPFGENVFALADHLDEDVELSARRFHRDVDALQSFLRAVPAGTYVATFNGFGGRIPDEYVQVCVDRTLPNILRLWRKADITGRAQPARSRPSE